MPIPPGWGQWALVHGWGVAGILLPSVSSSSSLGGTPDKGIPLGLELLQLVPSCSSGGYLCSPFPEELGVSTPCILVDSVHPLHSLHLEGIGEPHLLGECW